MQPELFIGLAILIISVVLHEVAHGHAANFLGDPTARLAGRLTLNPLRHLDPMGSVIIPLLLVLAHSPIFFGYAKPVPYNPYNLRGRFGEPIVAAAGPLTNLALATAAGLIIRIASGMGADASFIEVMSLAVYINLFLALFNLIPIPPLDGSKVIAGLLPRSLSLSYERLRVRIEAYGMLFGFGLILVIFYLFQPVFIGIVSSLFTLLTGR